MKAEAPGDFRVLPWPGSDGGRPNTELGLEEDQKGLLLRGGALLGLTVICKSFLLLPGHQQQTD